MRKKKIKGVAINVSFLLLLMLVMLVVAFLFVGVFKDFAFGQSGKFGLVPGTATLTITDEDTTKKVSVECSKSGKEYTYKITVNQLGFSYPLKAKAFPIFLFKGKIASAEPQPDGTETVDIPGRLSFSSIPIKSDIPPFPFVENIVIGFFKTSEEKCLSLAKSSAKFDDFVNECAKSLETETSVKARAEACK